VDYDLDMRLLERDEPLAMLHRLHAETAAQGGRLVFVEGEAGVGKTSLLRAFRASVPAGARTLLGSCDPLSTPRPMGPLVDVAEELDPEFARLVRTAAPRDEVLNSLLAALHRGSGDLVLLLDDLHWADEATLDALRFVGRRIDSTRTLVIGTFRDDEVGRQHPLRVVVGDLATSAAVHRLPLEPLSEDAVAELASGTGLDASELHERTGGNAFYVTEVIAGAPARIPRTVRDAVLARAARLSPDARRTLEAAAVIGPTVDPELLAAVLANPAAEECLANGLLQADDGRYQFRHEVAREAVLNATDPTARIDVHARILAALEQGIGEDRSLARLAHHAEGAADRAAMLRYAPEAAARASAASAHREAAAQYARAIRAADGLAPGARAELLVLFAREHGLITRYDRAIPAFEQAREIWAREDHPGREAAVLSEMAMNLVAVGRNAEAEAASRRALDLVDRLPDGPDKAEALHVQAYLRMLDRDNAEAIDLGTRALRMGLDHPEAAVTVMSAWNTVGSSRILLGDIEGGRADLETSLRLAQEHGLDRRVASAYSVLHSALGEMYRFGDAQPYFEAGHRYTSERDLDGSRQYLEAWQAISCMHRGRWSEAGTLAAEVLERQPHGTISRMMALLAAGRLRARRGDPDVWVALDEAIAIAEPTGTLQRIGPIRAARAEAFWLSGDPGQSAAEAGAAFDLALAKRHPWHIGELAWWQAKAGRAVADTARAAEPWRHQLDGRWREASAAWLALECPYEAARALLESSRIEDVEEAHGTFDELGAAPGAAMAARRLRELGARVIPRGRRPSTRANPAGLTARELEVLQLVASGLPNHAIAARLYLSPRTVDHHVSSVLGKLGVTRRVDAADAASRLGVELQIGRPATPI
jgi:DNA-binding CsgD family transcriptional regulator/tetratricopeptide (TPR) repeat protein